MSRPSLLASFAVSYSLLTAASAQNKSASLPEVPDELQPAKAVLAEKKPGE
ncbi:MAG: hypothetical protein ABIP20_04750 [Chthoniobacteraceae bacterium]